MTTIASDQAKKDFDDLLVRAAQGEEFLITRPGTPTVRMGPANGPTNAEVEEISLAIARIRELRGGNRLGTDLTIRQLIDEGRRF